MSQLKLVNTAFCLEKICESNYRKLFQLIPELKLLEKFAVGRKHNRPAIHLAILERNPYTLTIELSHRFILPHSEQAVPAIKIRVYLDAQMAEVIRDSDRAAVNNVFQNPGKILEVREYKWRLNYFLQKWLDHCLTTEYRF